MSAGLTKRQASVLRTLIDFQSERGFAPTVREICEREGLTSPSSVKYQLDQLEEKGYLCKDPRRPRTIEVTDKGWSALGQSPQTIDQDPILFPGATSRSVNVPLVGTIAAGIPITAEQLVEDVFTLPEELTGGGELFMLKVQGDSMIEAAICDGDWVVVRQQNAAENGEIVAAMLDDEATVKVLKRQNGHTWLLPCNELYEPIPADDCTILGKVVSVLRAL